MKNCSRPQLRGLSLVLAITTLGSIPAYAAGDTVETIVMVRHGEKPAAGLGQLSCQGLNRALALPQVIKGKYGKPDVIFAPDPAKQKNDSGTKYDYVRPLATIEPTAIYFGLPVNASIGFSKTDDLRTTISRPGRSAGSKSIGTRVRHDGAGIPCIRTSAFLTCFPRP